MNVPQPAFDNYYEPSIQTQHGQNIVELNGLLYDASEELKKARSNAQFQRQVYEAKLQELRDLLTITLRERDEAQEQLFKLKQIVAEHCSQHLKPSTTSQGRTKWADNPQGGNPISPQPVIDELQWDLPDHHNPLEFPTNEHENCRTTEDHSVECLNLAEKQILYQQNHQQHENNAVFLDEHPEAPQGQQPPESPLLRLVEDPITGQDVWLQNSKTSKTIGMSDTGPDTGSQMGYPNNSNLDNEMGLIPLSPSSMPLHLPAPPEADMQVILNTLPEKGKLLQAVMQAGPLLQSLLISGSLPRWRYPPPSFCKVETPILNVDHVQVHGAPNPQDLYLSPSNFHHTPNLVACTRNPTDFQHPLMYQAGSSSFQTGSASANFKPVFTTVPPDSAMKGRPKVLKLRSTKNAYQDTHNTLR